MRLFNRKHKYYKSLDTLPYYCFEKVGETGDLRYILRLDDYDNLPEISEKLTSELLDAWIKLRDDSWDIFRDNKDVVYYATLKKQYYKTFWAYHFGDGNKPMLNIKLKDIQSELKRYQETHKNDQGFYDRIEALEAYLHRDIDPLKISTAKVLNYINKMTNQKQTDGAKNPR